jgi:methyl-accepting chemotaxis protein
MVFPVVAAPRIFPPCDPLFFPEKRILHYRPYPVGFKIRTMFLAPIAGMVNSFCDTIGSGMSDIKGAQHKLAASNLELERNTRDMAASTSQVSNGVEQIREKARNQLQSAAASAAAVNQIAQNIESLDHSISTQFSSVSQASAAVEEMVGTIKSIGTVMEKMLKQFQEVIDKVC